MILIIDLDQIVEINKYVRGLLERIFFCSIHVVLWALYACAFSNMSH